MTIERNKALHTQLFEELSERIQSGALAEGERLPSLRDMAAERDLSLGTVQVAYNRLRAEGLTETPDGAQGGTRVAKRVQRTSGEYYKAGRDTGRIYGTTRQRSTILVAELTEAGEDVAMMLEVEPGTLVVMRERVVVDTDGVPVSTSTSFHRGELVSAAPALVETARVPQGTPQYIAERTGKQGRHVTDLVSARVASDREAELLHLPHGSPVLVTRNTLRDDDGYVIEYGISITPPGSEKVFRYTL